MAEEHRFSADIEQPGTRVQRSGWQSCLTGCLIVFVVLVVIAILVAVWVARNWRNWMADFTTAGIRHAIASSQLPAQEQQEIMIQVDRVAKAFREKTISNERLVVLAQRFAESPLMSLIVASTLEEQYFAKSGLSAEEKADGSRTLHRFVRGALDEKIDEPGIDAAMAHVADRDAGGNWQLRQTLTDDQLRAFLAEAKKQADAAEIPEQPVSIDPSDEFKKIVDEAMNAPTEQ
jgi:hypothetical protein